MSLCIRCNQNESFSFRGHESRLCATCLLIHIREFLDEPDRDAELHVQPSAGQTCPSCGGKGTWPADDGGMNMCIRCMGTGQVNPPSGG
jgi:DnaJ-class molecular chaperone